MTLALCSIDLSSSPCRRPDITVMVDWALTINYLPLLGAKVTKTVTEETIIKASGEKTVNRKETTSSGGAAPSQSSHVSVSIMTVFLILV